MRRRADQLLSLALLATALLLWSSPALCAASSSASGEAAAASSDAQQVCVDGDSQGQCSWGAGEGAAPSAAPSTRPTPAPTSPGNLAALEQLESQLTNVTQRLAELQVQVWSGRGPASVLCAPPPQQDRCRNARRNPFPCFRHAGGRPAGAGRQPRAADRRAAAAAAKRPASASRARRGRGPRARRRARGQQPPGRCAFLPLSHGLHRGDPPSSAHRSAPNAPHPPRRQQRRLHQRLARPLSHAGSPTAP